MKNDYEIIQLFEDKIAEYCGSKYAVSTDSCTNAIFLSLLYLKNKGDLHTGDTITIPSRTFLSVPMTLKNLGFKVKFKDIKWSGCYRLKPTIVYDSSVRLKKNMYETGSIRTLSFQYRKIIPIGRGGMILTDNKDAAYLLRQMRFNGKHEDISRWDDRFEVLGWDMYMTPEQAARGIILFNEISKKDNNDCGCWKDYPDLSKQEIFK